MGDNWSTQLVKDVVVPYLNDLLNRRGMADEIQFEYYDSYIPIIHTESDNSGTFSIVLGRVLIRRCGKIILEDSAYKIQTRIDFKNDDTAFQSTMTLISYCLNSQCDFKINEEHLPTECIHICGEYHATSTSLKILVPLN